MSGPRVGGEKREPPSPRFAKYRITRAELNVPVSPWQMYFYVDCPMARGCDSDVYFRVIARLAEPVELSEHGLPRSRGQTLPYWYKWKVVDEEGKTVRSWIAHFMRNRDGTYHTIVRQPERDWLRSVLEVYFEDVDGDGVREDVTYEIQVGDFVGEWLDRRERGGS